MKQGFIPLIVGLLLLLTLEVNASVNENFWKWFQKNSEVIFYFEKNQEKVFDNLSTALSKVDPELTFEFSSLQKNGKREFIISANGMKSSFSSVESLFDTAPILKKWKIIKFKQRHPKSTYLSYEGTSMNHTDVFYNLYNDEGKLGIILFFDNYNQAEYEKYVSIGFLLLDQILGEYDVATKLGFIEFHNKKSKYFEGARSLNKLALQVDSYYLQK